MLILIITTILLYKYIILLVVYLYICAVTNENDNVIDKLQLYGDNVILLKLGNTLFIGFYISNYLYTCII